MQQGYVYISTYILCDYFRAILERNEIASLELTADTGWIFFSLNIVYYYMYVILVKLPDRTNKLVHIHRLKKWL